MIQSRNLIFNISHFNVKLLQVIIIYLLLPVLQINAQNSMISDGFGGRLWYTPSGISTGSYSAYYACSNSCNLSNNQLYGWGSNNNWQFGVGTAIYGSDNPIALPGLTDVKYFSAGYMLGVIKNNNTGWISGNGITGPSIQVISNAYFVDACSYYVSFVKNDGTVWSSGTNGSGSFGNGTNSSNFNAIPVQMQSINNAVRVAASSKALIVLLNDSTLVSAGNNLQGQLGLVSSISETYTPLPIQGLPKIVDVKSNNLGSIALSLDGNVYTWGKDSTLLSTYYYSPFLIPNLDSIVAISACDDGNHFLALDENKKCFAWGDNQFGQCGLDFSINWVPSPQLVATDVVDIMTGETFSYLVKSDGTLWASGSSSNFGSIWLNLSNESRYEFTLLDKSFVTNVCNQFDIDLQITNCTDSTFGSIYISPINGQLPFSYSIGGVYQNSNFFDSLTSGNYILSIIDANGCEYNTSVTVEGENCTEIPFDIDLQITNCTDSTFGSIYISPINGQLPFSYSIGGVYQNSNFFDSLTSGNYILSIIDAEGSEYNTSVTVEGENCTEIPFEIPTYICFPNVISPNNDGINETLNFNSIGASSFNLTILNRWGNIIKNIEGINASWDGKTESGKLCAEGTYFYVLNYQFANGENHTYHGHVTLVR
jgi:gliding motility-associated-like protein